MVRTRDYAALLARLRAEAEAAARLHHPHIVQVFACGEHAGQPYFAMEYVEGGSLDRHLGGRPQPPHEAARLVLLLARAVHAAHRQGVVHRDLKPANILLAPPADEPALNSAYGCPKIADFGLARYLDSNSGQTGSGDLLGTPSYMAPEQAAGKTREVGPAADVYALGVILYEVLTGTPPFKGENALQTLERVQSQLPQPPGTLQPGVPPELESICLRCLRKDPTQRYATAADLADDLSAFLNGDVTSLVRSRHRRWTLIAAAVALLLVGSVVGIVLWNQQPPPPLPVASPPPVPPAPIVEQPKQPVQVKPLQVVKQPPSDWKEYRPPDGRFAISLPGLPIESKRIIKIRNKDLQAREARLSDSSTRALYSVVFVDFPGITFKGDAKASLDAARDSAVVTARGELLREVPLRLDGHPGREILIRGKLLQFRVRIYQVGQRMYQFTIAAARDLTSCAEADRFFQSFRLLPEP